MNALEILTKARDRAQIRKAEVLWMNYAAAMRRIGLHPLSWLEIGDRRHELRRHSEELASDSGDSICNRYLYLDRLKEASDGR